MGRPADRLHVGQAVTVKVLQVDDAKGKTSLSQKALEGDLWGKLRERRESTGGTRVVADRNVLTLIETDALAPTDSRDWLRAYAHEVLCERFRPHVPSGETDIEITVRRVP